jgi:hypothetical protein
MRPGSQVVFTERASVSKIGQRRHLARRRLQASHVLATERSGQLADETCIKHARRDVAVGNGPLLVFEHTEARRVEEVVHLLE